MQQFSVVLNQLIGMGVMLAVGAVCVRTKLLNEESLQGICRLILNVGIPMLVFSNAISGTTRADLFASAAIIGITILLYALLIASMWLLAKLLRLPGERGRMFQGAFVFGNAGFIGLPLVLALFPKHGALYFALMSLTDQLFLWTYGVWITKPRSNRQTFADEHPATSLGAKLLGMLSPALVAVILAIAIVLAGVPVPQTVIAPLHSLGAISTPLSMIYLGGLFILRDWVGVLKRYELYAGIVVKMLLFPIAFHALLTYVPPMIGLGAVAPSMANMMTIIAGLPTMSAIVMFSEREHNMPEYAVGLVLATTVASLFTLPVVSYLTF